jgi:hypothetical protein
MNNIYSISDQNFDFGKAPLKKASTNSTATQESEITGQSTQNYFDGGG